MEMRDNDTGDDVKVEHAEAEEDVEVQDGGQNNIPEGEGEGGEEMLQRSMSAVDRQYAAEVGQPRRIHIIGTGSIGKLVAHSLRGIAHPPPVTLIFHRYRLLKSWEESRKEITIQDNEYKVSRGGFEVELQLTKLRQHGLEIEKGQPGPYNFVGGIRPHQAAEILRRQREAPPSSSEQEAQPQDGTDAVSGSGKKRRPRAGEHAISQEPIHHLIVTTKAALTISALLSVKHRLSSSSTICFLQNGMGIIDDVNKHIFPEEASRPHYIQGIITHGVNVPPEDASRDPFFAVHAGHGTIALGLLPRAGMQDSPPSSTEPDNATSILNEQEPKRWGFRSYSSRYLLRTLTRTPVLSAVGFTTLELLQLQLEKLAVNSVLNPLTSLLDARNGALLYNFALSRTMRLLLAETSLVIRNLPELRGIPNVNTRFSAERLEILTVSVATKTSNNISSMLADVRAGRQTEIEYINGYIVRRGEEVGVKCVVNYAIMQTVIGKGMMTSRETREEVPLEGSVDLNMGS